MRQWRRQTAAIAAGGIDYAQVGNCYYEADGPLNATSSTLCVISPTQAVLTTGAGHRTVLTLVPSAKARTTTRACP